MLAAALAVMLGAGAAHSGEPLKAAPTNNPTPTPAQAVATDTPACPGPDPRCPPDWKTASPRPPIAADAAPTKAVSGVTPARQCTTVRRGLVSKAGTPPEEVNVASREALMKVPGVSATAAQQIISERGKAKFSNWDDVLQRAPAMQCGDFTGSALRVMGQSFGRGQNPKDPGW